MKLLSRLFLLAMLISGCIPDVSSSVLPADEHQDFGYSLAWSPDDKLLSITANTGLYVYNTQTRKQVAAFPRMSGATVDFSSEYMAAFNHEGLYVWDTAIFDLLFHEKASDPIQFQSIAISPDSRKLVTGEQNQFRVWDLPEGKVAAKIPIEGFISNLAFTEDNKLIAIEQYKAVVGEWDLQTLEKIRSFEILREVIFFTLSEDGKVMFADYGEAGVELWDVAVGEAQHYYRRMQGAEGWTRFSGDNRLAIVWGYAADGTHSAMGVWDLAADKRIYEFSTPFVNGDGWRAGALNSDGTVLAASNNEGYIYFYDLMSGKKIGEIHLPYKFKV